MKSLIKKLMLCFISKRCFKVTYTSKLDGYVGTIGFYGKTKYDVKEKFETEFKNAIVLNVSYP